MAKQPAPRRAMKGKAWEPVDLTLAEASAIKAIAAQHPVGYEAIITKICRFYEISFAEGGEDGKRETEYAEGKRAVAYALRAIVAMKMPATQVARGAPPES